MPTLYLVRHGDTAANDANIVRGDIDYPLNAKGKRQARLAGIFLRPKHPVRILASPVERAQETAGIISALTGARVITNSALETWRMGALQGLKLESVLPFSKFYQRNPDVKIPYGESFESFYDRWSKILHRAIRWARMHPGETLVLVAHTKCILASRDIIAGEPMRPLKYINIPAPGSVMAITINGPDIHMRQVFGQVEGPKGSH